MDRLLSDEEFYEQCPISSYAVTKPALEAQDLKSCSARDKEWVEWIDELFRIRFSNGEIEIKPYIAITYSEWQSRKKEIGL